MKIEIFFDKEWIVTENNVYSLKEDINLQVFQVRSFWFWSYNNNEFRNRFFYLDSAMIAALSRQQEETIEDMPFNTELEKLGECYRKIYNNHIHSFQYSRHYKKYNYEIIYSTKFEDLHNVSRYNLVHFGFVNSLEEAQEISIMISNYIIQGESK